jgi:hemolysin activation/secretion protein
MQLSRCLLLLPLAIAIAWGAFTANKAHAQAPILQTPREELPELPELEPPGAAPPERVLPPVPVFPEEDQLSGALRIFVREFKLAGNTVFSDAELHELLAPYTDREISSAELQQAGRVLTLYYVDHGYVNSGAVIPDQRVEDGVIELQIIEGRLAGVEIEGARWFRPSYFERRLMIGSELPLRVDRLEERLQLFQQDPRIRRINARLVPGVARGLAVLRLHVEEASPLDLGMEFANNEPVSIGEYTGRVFGGFSNVLGLGDELEGFVALTEGLNDYRASYELPLTKWDTSFITRFRSSDSEVIEEPFDAADIESRAVTIGLGLLQPLYRTPTTEFRIAILGDWRRTRTEIGGSGFSFPGSGADPHDGISKISVLRLGGDWIHRTRSQVLALRSLVSVGLEVLDATENAGDIPDTRFVSWLTQLQWAQRFAEVYNSELVFRTDLQLATQPLMPIEQIAVGGLRSVRGYLVNQLVRDQAVISSIEVRIPIFSRRDHVVQIAPFADIGHGWSVDRKGLDIGGALPLITPKAKTLVGVGVGIRYRFRNRLFGELYYGGQLIEAPSPSKNSLQSNGIYFLLRANLF